MSTNDQQPRRVPPQNLTVEQAVLGAMLLDRTAIDTAFEAGLNEKCFYSASSTAIFRAMSELHAQGVPVDLITLSEALKKAGQLENIGGTLYLSRLLDACDTTTHVEHHAKILIELAHDRNLIQKATNFVVAAYDQVEEKKSFLDEFGQAILEAADNRKTGLVSTKDAMKSYVKVLEDRMEHPREITGVRCGYESVDYMTSGFQESDFIVIAARPSVGKTAFALEAARNVSIAHGKPCCFFSLEMSRNKLMDRLISAQAGINGRYISSGNIPTLNLADVGNAISKVSNAEIYIDETGGLTPAVMSARARRLKQKCPELAIIFVDYLQLMTPNRKMQTRNEDIMAISGALKNMAKDLGIPVVALSQLSRAVESRGGDGRPQLSDLRDSGAIEQDADVVMFLHRPNFDRDDPPEIIPTELIIAKQRNGPIGLVNLGFDAKTTSFREMRTI